MDYDKLQDTVNNHKTIRQMLGHGLMDNDKTYPLQTLKDNIRLLTPELLDRIDTIVVEEGHKLLVKKKDQTLTGRCDSFVVETDVHYPTDINLLFDAHQTYIESAKQFIRKAFLTTETITSCDPKILVKIQELESYINHATWQVDLIRRRVIQGEKIPHADKVFSLFEPHTEWISKGKAGVRTACLHPGRSIWSYSAPSGDGKTNR